MIDLIFKIKNSQPTIVNEEAFRLFVSIVGNSNWVVISSAIHGLENTILYCDSFISSLARIEIHDESLLTLQPLHILYIEGVDTEWDRMWGLLYSNGAVCYSEKDDGLQFVILFIDQSLVDPSLIQEIRIDPNQLRVPSVVDELPS